MDVEAFEVHVGSYRIEVLIFDLALCPAIYGIGKIRAKAFDVKNDLLRFRLPRPG